MSIIRPLKPLHANVEGLSTTKWLWTKTENCDFVNCVSTYFQWKCSSSSYKKYFWIHVHLLNNFLLSSFRRKIRIMHDSSLISKKFTLNFVTPIARTKCDSSDMQIANVYLFLYAYKCWLAFDDFSVVLSCGILYWNKNTASLIILRKKIVCGKMAV